MEVRLFSSDFNSDRTTIVTIPVVTISIVTEDDR